MLALIGSGEYLPPMEAVDNFLLAQLPSVPHVVCLPTAAGTEGPERIRYWMELGEHYYSNLGVSVKSLAVIDRESANEPTLAAEIQSANYVFLSGGQPGYLAKTLMGSLAWQAITTVLANGGVLAGCSAGAMVMASHIPAFPRWQKAFNLLPGTVIIPHYDEIPNRLRKIIKLLTSRQSTLLGIEANTALYVNQNQYQVIGAGFVTVWNQKGCNRYASNQAIAF